MKKMLSLLTALSVFLGSAALAQAEPKSYEATTTGHNADLTVRVTLDGDAIASVDVIEHAETPGIADAALAEVPARIVASQSFNVDTCTGATITSRAIMTAASKALSDNGLDVSAYKTDAVTKGSSSETKELSADIVVVGAGAAGMATAVSAAQNGAQNVLVLESMSTIGGNAVVSGGFLEYMDAPKDMLPQDNNGYDAAVENLLAQDFSDNELVKGWQDTVREQYAAYKASGASYVFDSNELLALQYHVLQLGRPDDSLIGYAEKSHEVCEWFTSLGVNWTNCVEIIGFPWPRWAQVVGTPGGTGYFNALTQTISTQNLPVSILTETRASDLIEQDGKVVGVIAQNVDGTTYRISADKVVLATGGFGANKEMLKQYNTQWDNIENMLSDNRSGNQGDGIVMAQAVGAGVALMDQYMVFPMASPLDGHLARGINGNFSLYVNPEGKRFVDETQPRNTISQAILNQTDGICYIICDQANSGIVDGKATGGENIEFLKKIHAVYEADTIEELAEQIGCDPETLKATVKTYNKAAESYHDEEFGRTVFPEGCVIDEGPFYACPRTPAVHILLGGLTCAPTGEVISESNEAIPGLYAVGEVTVGGAALSSFADGMKLGEYLFQ